MKIVIPGGSGLCGRLLAKHFAAKGWEVVALSRRAAQVPGARVVTWDGRTMEGDWIQEIDGADAVINLCGRSVNCRYYADNCAEIYASRLDSTRIIGEAIAACENPPPVWLNAASATIYRHAEDRPMDEFTGEIGTGFSVDVCRRWEQAFFDADVPLTRRVALRSAIVFSAEPGGVWHPFAAIARLGLAGPMAGGHHFVSWVHGTDFCRAVEWIRERPEIDGVINIASPNPLTNSEFLRQIRHAVGAPFGLPSARWMLEIAAFFHRTETELLLKSRYVVPTKLLESGFTFQFPAWPGAAANIAHARHAQPGLEPGIGKC